MENKKKCQEIMLNFSLDVVLQGNQDKRWRVKGRQGAGNVSDSEIAKKLSRSPEEAANDLPEGDILEEGLMA